MSIMDSDIKEINTAFFDKFIDTANFVSSCCDITECENCPMYIDMKCELNTPALWDMKRIEMNYNNMIKRIKENNNENNNNRNKN